MANTKKEAAIDLEMVTLIAKGLDYSAVAEEMGLEYRQVSTRIARRLSLSRAVIRGFAKEGMKPKEILAQSPRYQEAKPARIMAKKEESFRHMPAEALEDIREAMASVIDKALGDFFMRLEELITGKREE